MILKAIKFTVLTGAVLAGTGFLLFGTNLGSYLGTVAGSVHEGIEGAIGVAKLGGVHAAGAESIAAACELVGDQRGEDVDGRHALGLRLEEARFEHLGHAAEAELLESAVELDQVHGSFSFALVMRSMTSR